MNRCDYCAKLAAVENCEMLVLDALEGDAPQLVAILGTRTPELDMDAFERARAKMVRAVKRRWPDAEYAYEVEFTTGYGPRSGGLRRPHWNWFWKHVPRDDIERFRAIVVGQWCKAVDAEPQAQYVQEVDNAVGLTKYVTEHFMKASQRPPRGFAGHRFVTSHRYFGNISRAVARRRARESLRRKRELHKALEAGFAAHEAELIAHENYAQALNTAWVLTNERGARIGITQHDGRRQALPRDRRQCAVLRMPFRRLSALATASGVAVAAHRAARRRAYAQAMRARLAAQGFERPDGVLRMFDVRLSALHDAEAPGAGRVEPAPHPTPLSPYATPLERPPR